MLVLHACGRYASYKTSEILLKGLCFIYSTIHIIHITYHTIKKPFFPTQTYLYYISNQLTGLLPELYVSFLK